MNIPIDQLPFWAYPIIGVISILLGLSFLYKFWNAFIMGRCHYWDGFLPITIISPWFIHTKPKKNTLIKTKYGLICHALVGPLFFVTAVPLLVLGFDIVGMKGTDCTNYVLNVGNSGKGPAIVYSAPVNYHFPIVDSSKGRIVEILNTQIYIHPSKVMFASNVRRAKGS